MTPPALQKLYAHSTLVTASHGRYIDLEESTLRFEVLGPLRVTLGDASTPLGGRQQQVLLAVLLSSPNQLVSSDRLIDEIWGEMPPASARHLIQVYVSRLRGILKESVGAERFLREGSSYGLRVEVDELDCTRFAALADQAHTVLADSPARAARILQQTRAMWRGRPFGDLTDESPMLQTEAARLEEIYLRAVADYFRARLDLGDHETLVADLETFTTLYPYRERFWIQLMLALYRSGRQVDALRTCRQLTEHLGDVGLDLSSEVLDLEERILLHDPDLLWEPLPPGSNLPKHLTSFVGRAVEIADLAKLLDTARLVTVTGPGGVGKTRLAVQVSEQAMLRFGDGAWWWILLLWAAFGLIRRKALLVIDNCEHLASAVAETVDILLREAGKIHVLATSRVPLHVAGETVWRLPAMAMPLEKLPAEQLPGSDAIRLFIDRASTIDPTFSLSDGNASAVVDICQRLDALPLAIEMAAARIPMLSPLQIADSLADRFSLLTHNEHGADPRHQTLKAALDWSYDLLPRAAQAFFVRLSVFKGVFDFDAAEAVTGVEHRAVLDLMTQLVEASLVVTVTGEADRARYRMLETVRDYAAARLLESGEAQSIGAAHGRYFLQLVMDATDSVGTPGFTIRHREIKAAYEDVRHALGWSLDNDERSVTLATAPVLFHYWFRSGDALEAGHWGTRMLEASSEAPAHLRAAAHAAISFSATILGNPADSQHHINEAESLYRKAGDLSGLVTALFGKGHASLQIGDFDTARSSCDEALNICEKTGDRWGRAGHLATLSFVQMYGGGSLDEARLLAEEAQALFKELDDRASQVIMNPLAAIALMQRRLDDAYRLAVESVTVAPGTGWETCALVNLADVLRARGDVNAAEVTLRRGMMSALDRGLENWFRIALRDMARLAAQRGDARHAALLVGASRSNMPAFGLDPTIYGPIEAFCRDDLGDMEYELAVDEGRRMSHEQLLGLSQNE